MGDSKIVAGLKRGENPRLALVNSVDTVSEHLDLMPCGATTLAKHVVEVSGSNSGGGFGNLGGGRETRGGGDGFEGPGGQVSIADT
ncbi:hypothetical protein Tco_1081653 [Tanacetum coccineum]|uniref:Uncharacterized protein n=1 Tax=Tanacetum coccineum TaxID=301880 RepID=A0ABQ5HYA8_9ASTR